MLEHGSENHQALPVVDGVCPVEPVVPDANEGLEETLSGVETSELVLLSCIEELAALVKACRNICTPQQWIGSSIMLAFDSELRPLRSALHQGERLPPGAATQIANARTSIFDWGRSELSMPPDKQKSLRWESRKEREQCWGRYCGGVAMLLFDCCLVYVRRYWRPKRSVSLSVWDRDIYTLNDIVGVLCAPLEPTPVTTAEIDESRGDFTRDEVTELTYSIAKLDLPEPTRLEDTWAVTVHRAGNIPRLDMLSKSDGFVHVQPWCDPVEVSEGAENGLDAEAAHNLLSIAAQSTTVAQDHDSAVWEETFQIGSLKRSGRNPFIQALLKAWDGDGGLELDPDIDSSQGPLDGNFIEKGRSDDGNKYLYGDDQITVLQTFTLENFFPTGLLEADRRLAGGLGGDTSKQENAFVRYCFPELSRKGLLSHGKGQNAMLYSWEKRLACAVSLFVLLALWSMALVMISAANIKRDATADASSGSA
jgi:hypothetical protein